MSKLIQISDSCLLIAISVLPTHIGESSFSLNSYHSSLPSFPTSISAVSIVAAPDWSIHFWHVIPFQHSVPRTGVPLLHSYLYAHSALSVSVHSHRFLYSGSNSTPGSCDYLFEEPSPEVHKQAPFAYLRHATCFLLSGRYDFIAIGPLLGKNPFFSLATTYHRATLPFFEASTPTISCSAGFCAYSQTMICLQR